MSGTRWLLPAVVSGCVGLAGCSSTPRVGCYQTPCDNCTPSGRVVPVPVRPDVLPEGNFIQPQRSTFDPAAPPVQPGQPGQSTPSFQPVPPAGDQQSTLRPGTGDAGARQAPPENGSAQQPDVRLKGPESSQEPPKAQGPAPQQNLPPMMPPASDTVEEKLPTVDIPGVVQVRPRLLTGQQPFPDGIRWLSQHTATGRSCTSVHPRNRIPRPSASSRSRISATSSCASRPSRSRRRRLTRSTVRLPMQPPRLPLCRLRTP